MNRDLAEQQAYWDKEVVAFDSIYSHDKGRFANWIDANFRRSMYARFEFTVQHAEPIVGRTFLDVGCGTGRYALEFARRGARQVLGIDISEQMLQVCRDRARAANLSERCVFLQTDLIQFQPDSTFDVCIGIGLFDYIRNPSPVLTKMREVTRDRVLASFPQLWVWQVLARKAWLATKGLDAYFYTRRQLVSLLQQAGFKRYEIEPVGTLFCVSAFVS